MQNETVKQYLDQGYNRSGHSPDCIYRNDETGITVGRVLLTKAGLGGRWYLHHQVFVYVNVNTEEITGIDEVLKDFRLTEEQEEKAKHIALSDPEGVFQYRELTKQLSDEGKTIFISSHILSEVSKVCNTIGIISKGTLIARGTLEELKNELGRVGAENLRIIVETIEPLPEITHEDIISAEYSETKRKVIIEAKSDIRDYISSELFEKGAKIKEMRMEEPTLEDVFLSVYLR
jgi:hypothetical protein